MEHFRCSELYFLLIKLKRAGCLNMHLEKLRLNFSSLWSVLSHLHHPLPSLFLYGLLLRTCISLVFFCLGKQLFSGFLEFNIKVHVILNVTK